MRALQTHCPGVCSWMMVVLVFLFSVSANAFFFVDEFIGDVKQPDSAFHLWSETDASLCCCSGSSLCFDFTVNPCRFSHASCFPLSYTCGFFVPSSFWFIMENEFLLPVQLPSCLLCPCVSWSSTTPVRGKTQHQSTWLIVFFIGSYYLKQGKWICLYNLNGSWYTTYIREVWLPKICWYSGTLRGELVSCLNSLSVHSKCSLRQNLLTLDSYQRKVNTWRMEAEGQQSNQ